MLKLAGQINDRSIQNNKIFIESLQSSGKRSNEFWTKMICRIQETNTRVLLRQSVISNYSRDLALNRIHKKASNCNVLLSESCGDEDLMEIVVKLSGGQ